MSATLNGHKLKSDDTASVHSSATARTKNGTAIKKSKEIPESVLIRSSKIGDLFEDGLDGRVRNAIIEIGNAFRKVKVSEVKDENGRFKYRIDPITKINNLSDVTRQILDIAKAKYSQDTQEDHRKEVLAKFHKTPEYVAWKTKNVAEIKTYQAYEKAVEAHVANAKKVGEEKAGAAPAEPAGYNKYRQFCQHRRDYRTQHSLYKENLSKGMFVSKPIAPYYPGEPVPNIGTNYTDSEDYNEYTEAISVLSNMRYKVGKDSHLQITSFATLLVKSIFEGAIAVVEKRGFVADKSVKVTLQDVADSISANTYRNLIRCLKCYDQMVHDLANPKIVIRKKKAKEEKKDEKKSRKGKKAPAEEEEDSDESDDDDDDESVKQTLHDSIPVGGDAESTQAAKAPRKAKVHDIYKHKSSISAIRNEVIAQARLTYPQLVTCKKIQIAKEVVDFCNSLINQFVEMVAFSVKDYAQQNLVKTIQAGMIEVSIRILCRGFGIHYETLEKIIQSMIDQYKNFMSRKNENRKKTQDMTMKNGAGVPETVEEEKEEVVEVKPKKEKKKPKKVEEVKPKKEKKKSKKVEESEDEEVVEDDE